MNINLHVNQHIYMLHAIRRNNIKLASWNVQGMPYEPDSTCSRTLCHDFTESVKGYDIVALTETHLGDGETFDIDEYYSFHLTRPKHKKATKSSGGISVLIRSKIRKGIKIMQTACKDYVWLELFQLRSTFIHMHSLFTTHALLNLSQAARL